MTPLTSQWVNQDLEVLFYSILDGRLLKTQAPGDLLQDLVHKVLITDRLIVTTTECIQMVHMFHIIILKTQTQEAVHKESSMVMIMTVLHTSNPHFTQARMNPLTSQCVVQDLEVLLSSILETVIPDYVEMVHMIHRIILKTQTQEVVHKDQDLEVLLSSTLGNLLKT